MTDEETRRGGQAERRVEGCAGGDYSLKRDQLFTEEPPEVSEASYFPCILSSFLRSFLPLHPFEAAATMCPRP